MTLTPSHASVCGRGHGGPPSHLRSVEAVLHGGPVGPENARTCLPGDERAAIERSVLRGIVEAAVAALEKWHSRRVDTMGRSSACRSTGKDRTEEQRKRGGPPPPPPVAGARERSAGRRPAAEGPSGPTRRACGIVADVGDKMSGSSGVRCCAVRALAGAGKLAGRGDRDGRDAVAYTTVELASVALDVHPVT